MAGKVTGACAAFLARGRELIGSIVSHPPKQKMVGAVVPSDGFTAVRQSEVLVAVTARND